MKIFIAMKKIRRIIFEYDDIEFSLRFKLIQTLSYPYLKIRLKKYFFNSYIHPTVSIQNFGKISIGHNSHIHKNTIIWADCKIGDVVIIGPHNAVYGIVEFGNHIMVSAGCVFSGGGHGFEDTAVPMQHQKNPSKGGIIIADDVWIGSNSTILDGVKVGTGAIVAAGSVVTKNVDPFTIVAGIPAQIIRSRI
jgi:acetyltransferase-like isoleucine patch superfamily enzyme